MLGCKLIKGILKDSMVWAQQMVGDIFRSEPPPNRTPAVPDHTSPRNEAHQNSTPIANESPTTAMDPIVAVIRHLLPLHRRSAMDASNPVADVRIGVDREAASATVEWTEEGIPGLTHHLLKNNWGFPKAFLIHVFFSSKRCQGITQKNQYYRKLKKNSILYFIEKHNS